MFSGGLCLGDNLSSSFHPLWPDLHSSVLVFLRHLGDWGWSRGWVKEKELCDFHNSEYELNALNLYLKVALSNIKMNVKGYANDLKFSFSLLRRTLKWQLKSIMTS